MNYKHMVVLMRLFILKGNKFAIIYNDDVYHRRLRFTLAHEYGHYIMEHDGMSYKHPISKMHNELI